MKELTDWKKDRILAARNGKNPMVITVMKSGYAVIGDTQFLPGYCVLLPFNRVNSIEDLVVKDRMNYMLDMTLIGEAILKVCKPKESTIQSMETQMHFYMRIYFLGTIGNQTK